MAADSWIPRVAAAALASFAMLEDDLLRAGRPLELPT